MEKSKETSELLGSKYYNNAKEKKYRSQEKKLLLSFVQAHKMVTLR